MSKIANRLEMHHGCRIQLGALQLPHSLCSTAVLQVISEKQTNKKETTTYENDCNKSSNFVLFNKSPLSLNKFKCFFFCVCVKQ